jgi:predicted nucleotidyltransferase
VTATYDPLAIAQHVTAVLDRLGVRYSIGGSIASAFAGEPRSTLDVDIVVALAPAEADSLADALSADFYLDRARLQHAVATRALGANEDD